MNLDVVSHGQIICMYYVCMHMYIRSAEARLQCAKSQSHRKSRLKHSAGQHSFEKFVNFRFTKKASKFETISIFVAFSECPNFT